MVVVDGGQKLLNSGELSGLSKYQRFYRGSHRKVETVSIYLVSIMQYGICDGLWIIFPSGKKSLLDGVDGSSSFAVADWLVS